MSDLRLAEASFIFLVNCACLTLSVSLSSISLKPITAFNGVLISWLTFARNLVFSLLACSAKSLASCNLLSIIATYIGIIDRSITPEVERRYSSRQYGVNKHITINPHNDRPAQRINSICPYLNPFPTVNHT